MESALTRSTEKKQVGRKTYGDTEIKPNKASTEARKVQRSSQLQDTVQVPMKNKLHSAASRRKKSQVADSVQTSAQLISSLGYKVWHTFMTMSVAHCVGSS